MVGQVDLVPDGSNKAVTFANVGEYIDLVIKARLSESKAQARAIRKGFNHVVPVGMLSLFSWCVLCDPSLWHQLCWLRGRG